MSRTILMLEHDEDDRYITKAVFNENSYQVSLNFVTSSDEAFLYLQQCKESNKYPSLILLNYNAGPSNAVEILSKLKASAHYNHIPVIVLSGVVNDKIVQECYEAGASSFIQKPDTSLDTDKKISSFFHYWFETVELPN
ncbi:response regulator [Chryseosolibacter indicus]|uniref:Response regulator n=1 Tax=Chryseosolibacter indicus TaxID=2782351 RepID=A0ABS5VNN8_9BACT|nr:response regulator [Chryseosolibacter indicus]MBT1702397.1 response regulator [Chryseosolibacter indicus]